MFYSNPEKIKHILSFFNITNISYSFNVPGFDIQLVNLINNQDFHVFSYYPLYNILTYGTKFGQNNKPIGLDAIFDVYDDSILYYYNMDVGTNDYKNEEEFKRFKIYKMKNYSKLFFGFYDNLTTLDDIKSIFNLCGVNNVPVKKYGDFVIDDNGNLRIQQFPYEILDTNVSKCYFGEFQIYRINSFDYKFQYVIYEKNNRPLLYLHNSFINKLTGLSDVNIDLSSVLCDQDTLSIDLNDISKYESEYFIIHNFLNFVIFRNTSNGIYRQTPRFFNKDFFKILNDNVGFNIYNQNGNNLKNELNYTFGATDIHVDLSYRFIDYDILKNLGIFGGIPDVESDAEDYNDAIFNLTSNISPVMFVVR